MTPIAALVCAVAIADWGPIRVDAEGVPLPPGVIARIGSTRMRHDGHLSDVHFSPDGRWIAGRYNRDAIFNKDLSLTIWDLRTGKRHHVEAIPGYLRDASAWRADGKLVFAMIVRDGAESTIYFRTLDVETGIATTVKRFEGDGIPYVSPDGTRAAIRGHGYVRVFDTRTGKSVGETRLSISDYDPVAVVISPDNRLLAAAYAGWIEVREIATGNVAYSGVPPVGSQVRDAVFSPDARELCCVVEKEKTFAVETIDLKTEKRIELLQAQSFFSPTFSRDGRTLFGYRDSELIRIDRASKAITTLAKGMYRDIETRLALSPDGTALAAGGIRHRLTLHDSKTGRRLPPVQDRFEPAISKIEFTADGTRLAFNSDYSEENSHLVDIATGRVLKTVEYDHSSGRFLSNGKEYAIATAKGLQVRSFVDDQVRWKADFDPPWMSSIRSAAGGTILSADGEKGYYFWNRATGKSSGPYPSNRSEYYPSPDGRCAVHCSWKKDNGEGSEINLLDLSTQKHHPSWPKIEDMLRDAQFDSSSRIAVLCMYNASVMVVDLSTFDGRVSPIETGTNLGCNPSLSRDGRMLAVVPDENLVVRLWELSSGKIRHTIQLADNARSLAFSPDARMLAIHSTIAPVHLYDLRGQLLDLPKRIDWETLLALWKTLGGNDAQQAFVALRQLAAASESTIPFIRDRVRPTAIVPRPTIYALLEALDAPAFADREKAMKEIMRIAEAVETELRAAEKATPSPEVRQRLEKILLSLRPESPESVRRSRIVEVVEWCGTPDAKKLLKEWAAGAPGACLTREAKEALARPGG